MKLVVLLGNIGTKYAFTRHNTGFLFGDFLLTPYADYKEVSKLHSYVLKVGDLIFIKPTTYMNLSGKAVKKTLDFYKIPLSDLIVVHDDVDIALGEFKYTQSASSAGHKGVESIIENVGTQVFQRIRIGVGKSNNPNIETDVWVLQSFSKTELLALDVVFGKVKTSYFSNL